MAKENDFVAACGAKRMTKPKYANGGQVGLSERKERLKEQMLGYEKPELELDIPEDDFLSEEEPHMADGGIVEEPNIKRKNRLKSIISQNLFKKA